MFACLLVCLFVCVCAFKLFACLFVLCPCVLCCVVLCCAVLCCVVVRAFCRVVVALFLFGVFACFFAFLLACVCVFVGCFVCLCAFSPVCVLRVGFWFCGGVGSKGNGKFPWPQSSDPGRKIGTRSWGATMFWGSQAQWVSL